MSNTDKSAGSVISKRKQEGEKGKEINILTIYNGVQYIQIY